MVSLQDEAFLQVLVGLLLVNFSTLTNLTNELVECLVNIGPSLGTCLDVALRVKGNNEMRKEMRRERERKRGEGDRRRRRGKRRERGEERRGSIMILAAKQSGELSAFRLGHCPPVGEVSLVGNEDEGDVIIVLGPYDLVPEERGLVEGGP